MMRVKRLAYWKPFSFKNSPIDLGHLEPFDFRCNTGVAERKVSVIFGHHTFTRTHKHGDPADELCFRDRIFCPERYSQSAKLPAIVQGLPGCSVIQTWEANAYVYLATEVQTQVGLYHVFFNLKRHDESKKDKRVRLTIESAYDAETYAQIDRPKTILFPNLVENIFMGRKINFHRR